MPSSADALSGIWLTIGGGLGIGFILTGLLVVFEHRMWGWAYILIGAFVVYASVEIALHPDIASSGWSWRFVVLAVVCVGIVSIWTAGLSARWKDSKIVARLRYWRSPRLRFTEYVPVRGIPPLPETATEEQWRAPAEQSIAAKLRRPHVVALKVSNDPFTTSPEGTANNLRAYLTFYDDSWNKLFATLPGAWFDKKPAHGDAEQFPYMHCAPIRLSAGDETCLAIAVKFPGDDCGYALSEESIGVPDWKKAGWRLSFASYVKIEIRGDHVLEHRSLSLKPSGLMFGLTPGFVLPTQQSEHWWYWPSAAVVLVSVLIAQVVFMHTPQPTARCPRESVRANALNITLPDLVRPYEENSQEDGDRERERFLCAWMGVEAEIIDKTKSGDFYRVVALKDGVTVTMDFKPEYSNNVARQRPKERILANGMVTSLGHRRVGLGYAEWVAPSTLTPTSMPTNTPTPTPKVPPPTPTATPTPQSDNARSGALDTAEILIANPPVTATPLRGTCDLPGKLAQGSAQLINYTGRLVTIEPNGSSFTGDVYLGQIRWNEGQRSFEPTGPMGETKLPFDLIIKRACVSHPGVVRIGGTMFGGLPLSTTEDCTDFCPDGFRVEAGATVRCECRGKCPTDRIMDCGITGYFQHR